MMNGLKLLSKTKNYLISLLALLTILSLSGCHQAITGILNPKGLIAYQERQLLFDALALMMIVVIPVIIMSFAFIYRYRASHKTSDYQPDWAHNNILETICWGVPCAIIVVLGIMTWKKTHSLDPYRQIPMPGKPLLIQAVSLQWKWLFIYPKQNIATINFVEIPRGRQVQFWITSDAPMSAFFIPQLGSQIYAMAGMRTRLHLVGNQDGTYQGLNSQFNGGGFSDMHFSAKVVEPRAMQAWVKKVKQTRQRLSINEYKKIVQPSVANPPQYFSSVKPGLFKRIMQQYMMPNMRLH